MTTCNETSIMKVVNEDGALAWSPIVMHPSFHPDLPPITYLRLTTSTGQVRLAHARTAVLDSSTTKFRCTATILCTALPTWHVLVFVAGADNDAKPCHVHRGQHCVKHC